MGARGRVRGRPGRPPSHTHTHTHARAQGPRTAGTGHPPSKQGHSPFFLVGGEGRTPGRDTLEQDRIPGQTRARGTAERGCRNGRRHGPLLRSSHSPCAQREGGEQGRRGGARVWEGRKGDKKNRDKKNRLKKKRKRRQRPAAAAAVASGVGAATRVRERTARHVLRNKRTERQEGEKGRYRFVFLRQCSDRRRGDRQSTHTIRKPDRKTRPPCVRESGAASTRCARGARPLGTAPAQKGRRRRRLGETISRGVDGSRGGGGRLPLARHHHDADGSPAVRGGPPLKDNGVVCVGGREGRGGTKR